MVQGMDQLCSSLTFQKLVKEYVCDTLGTLPYLWQVSQIVSLVPRCCRCRVLCCQPPCSRLGVSTQLHVAGMRSRAQPAEPGQLLPPRLPPLPQLLLSGVRRRRQAAMAAQQGSGSSAEVGREAEVVGLRPGQGRGRADEGLHRRAAFGRQRRVVDQLVVHHAGLRMRILSYENPWVGCEGELPHALAGRQYRVDPRRTAIVQPSGGDRLVRGVDELHRRRIAAVEAAVREGGAAGACAHRRRRRRQRRGGGRQLRGSNAGGDAVSLRSVMGGESPTGLLQAKLPGAGGCAGRSTAI